MKQQGERTVPVILEEVQSTGKGWLDLCNKSGGTATTAFRAELGRESLNVYMRQMVSVRFSEKLTPKYQDVRACLENIFSRISAGNPGDYMPILNMFGRPKVLDEMEHWADKMYGHIRGWINEHKATIDKERPRDFLDQMLIQQKEHGLTDVDIEVIMWDVMAGGIDTTATTLEWLLYIMCVYPDTQRKIQEELEREIGPDRLPHYDDREKLPYLQAVILELMRFKHFAPFGLPHQTLENTQLLGYNIPKNTQVLINFHAIGYDEKAWKKPEQWRPERWLEEEKHLQSAFLDSEAVLARKGAEAFKFMPFGAGKRMCVGYGLGRVVMWCKVATHLHCFNFSSDGAPPDIDTEAFGVTLMPKEQRIRITPRPASKLLKSIEESFKGTTV